MTFESGARGQLRHYIETLGPAVLGAAAYVLNKDSPIDAVVTGGTVMTIGSTVSAIAKNIQKPQRLLDTHIGDNALADHLITLLGVNTIIAAAAGGISADQGIVGGACTIIGGTVGIVSTNVASTLALVTRAFRLD